MKISNIIKSSVCVLGVVGLGNFLAAPANAQQASARAAVTITNPGSFTQTVSGEVTLPSGLYFGGIEAVPPVDADDPGVSAATLVVTPTLNPGIVETEDADGNITTVLSTGQTIGSLSFDAGPAKSVSSVNGAGKISDVVAAILKGTNSNQPIDPDTEEPVADSVNTAVNAASIDDAAAIIKAAAGINGLE